MSDGEILSLQELQYAIKNIGSFDLGDFNYDTIETVLNLIEKQQKEIEKLRNNNKNLLRKLRNRVKEVKKLEKYSVYKKEFSTLNKKLQQKDKIIDELEDIFYNYQLCEYELTDCAYRKCEYIADNEKAPCKECIKEYFES